MSTSMNEMTATEKRPLETEIESTKPGATFTCPVDIFEDTDSITVLADMPGVTPECLEIDLREGLLTLQGEVTPPEQEKEEDVHREFESGTFYRQFRLSDSIDQDKIDARLVDGVLTLKLPKVAAAKPRRIEIKSR